MTETGESRGDVGGPWWWGRPRGVVLDVVLALMSAVECGWKGASFAGELGLPVWVAVGLGAVVGGTLVLRRRWPVAVVLLGIAVTPAEMGGLLRLVGLYTLAASDAPRRTIGLLAGMQSVGVLIVVLIRMHRSIGRAPDFNPSAWFLPSVPVVMAVTVTAPPLLLGLYVGARRRLVVSLRERADGLERELALLADRAEERAEWARNEERTRIAREMHDVVAHRVSLMVVHAAALQTVALRSPEKASRNAALVGDMGRQALTELRTMLGVLRSQDEVGEGAGADSAGGVSGDACGAGPGGGSCDGSGVPTDVPESAAAAGVRTGAGGDSGAEGEVGPRLGELETLVGQSRAAGMVVDFAVDAGDEGDEADEDMGGSGGASGRGYGSQVERTAFRVVQEALTNVHKHAAGARTRVRLARRVAEVAVQVENGPPAVVPDAGLPSGGNGLAGMRERVTALGGGFVSGPTEEGGFRVSAVIPAGGAGSVGSGAG